MDLNAIYYSEEYISEYAFYPDADARDQREALFIADALSLCREDLILDAGCGYGRHALQLAHFGYSIVAIDACRPLLAHLKGSASKLGIKIATACEDMLSFSHFDTYTAAYCMFSTLAAFNDMEVSEVIRRLARSLKAGGRILLDFDNHSSIIRNFSTESWRQLPCRDFVLNTRSYDVKTGTVTGKRIRIGKDGISREFTFQLRLYTYLEIASHFQEAGLTCEIAYGDYNKRPFDFDSERMILIAVKNG